ncbi:MAG: type I phosphomannose isomerase catalytic subunit [Planctomycetota bacterium]
MSSPYPLTFEPILKDKVWGGRRLAAFGKKLPDTVPIGESWELADLDATSVSGGGGGAEHSIISSGRFRGRNIREAVRTWGTSLYGRAKPGPKGAFPLLVKFLDAKENLSVQVHPSPAYAAAHPGANLKTECWLIMAAEPGSVIYKGLKPGVTREKFAEHIRSGKAVDDMISVPAVVGECHNLPSGTCHALGAGVLVAEVQTPSDTTFRVFDWGRKGRELHVEQALACIDFAPAPDATRVPEGKTKGPLVKTEFFSVEGVNLTAGASVDVGPSDGRCAVVMVLRGEGTLVGRGSPETRLSAGATVLVPASLADVVQIRSAAGLSGLIAFVG